MFRSVYININQLSLKQSHALSDLTVPILEEDTRVERSQALCVLPHSQWEQGQDLNLSDFNNFALETPCVSVALNCLEVDLL